jgi:nucleoid-associated protein YgaU
VNSDTAIGLLLGFSFIAIIIFLIQGLPNWRKVPTEDEPQKICRINYKPKPSTIEHAKKAVNEINRQKRLIDISSTINESMTVKELRTTEYIVKHGDSLWQISVKLLGDGNRYREIIELNKEAIQDEKSISVGTHLKIPCKKLTKYHSRNQ